MMMMLGMAKEFGWRGPMVMEGLRLRDASYSRRSPRPSATAGKKLRHFGQKKDFCSQINFVQWIHAAFRVMCSPPQVDFF